MKIYARVYWTAAEMLVPEGEAPDPGKLNPSLADTLGRAHELCARADGELVSRQAIAAVIVAWQQGALVSAYGPEFLPTKA